MATVEDLINDVRIELDDQAKSRFSDATLLSIVKKALRRANRVIQRNQLHFAKKKATLTTVAGQDYVDLPSDFDVPVPRGLWRTDTREEVPLLREPDWEAIPSGAESSNYARIDPESNRLELKNTPSSSITLDLYYYPTVSAASVTLGTEMPWGGRLDDAIVEYATLRARNIDEQDVSVDTQLLADFESQILDSYRNLVPTMILPVGPYEGLT